MDVSAYPHWHMRFSWIGSRYNYLRMSYTIVAINMESLILKNPLQLMAANPLKFSSLFNINNNSTSAIANVRSVNLEKEFLPTLLVNAVAKQYGDMMTKIPPVGRKFFIGESRRQGSGTRSNNMFDKMQPNWPRSSGNSWASPCRNRTRWRSWGKSDVNTLSPRKNDSTNWTNYGLVCWCSDASFD